MKIWLVLSIFTHAVVFFVFFFQLNLNDWIMESIPSLPLKDLNGVHFTGNKEQLDPASFRCFSRCIFIINQSLVRNQSAFNFRELFGVLIIYQYSMWTKYTYSYEYVIWPKYWHRIMPHEKLKCQTCTGPDFTSYLHYHSNPLQWSTSYIRYKVTITSRRNWCTEEYLLCVWWIQDRYLHSIT